MQKAKVDVLIVLFAYGGNGGTASIIPQLAIWLMRLAIKMKSDERIGRIQPEILSDTPITMTRNRAVKMAKDGGFDMILMLDSDNEPDGYFPHDPLAKPFWDEVFGFSYERLMRGMPTVIAAPYCGPPPHPCPPPWITDGGELPYLFDWRDNESDTPNPGRKLEMLNRNEAAKLTGIYPVAALPTGVCLFTTNSFDGLPKPYFDYEWNEDHSEKASTEDVYCTRNISLFWKIKKGWDVLFAACDSWALHHKPKKVGKPRTTPVEVMAKSFREALADPISLYDSNRVVDFTANLPANLPTADALAEEFTAATAAVEKAESSGTLFETEERWEPNLDYVTAANDGRAVEVVVEKVKQNGDCLKHKMIGGRKVAMLPAEVSDESLEQIESMTRWMVDKSGPLEVAVIHPGSGQSAAAILSALPEGSHLYALDSIGTYKMSSEPSSRFLKSFEPELETGRVMADIIGRKFPYPENRQHLDIVFIERSLTKEKLATWLDHLNHGGLLAGLGNSKMVSDFAESKSLKLTVSGDVWAMRM